jgi:primosomal protein N' (replication factor Y)
VLVQTRHPTHHALRHAARHDAEGFIAEELMLRREPAYPPETALVNLVVSGPDQSATGSRAADVADWCQGLEDRYRLGVSVLGPAPCPLARIKERWRWHVLLKGEGTALGRIVRYAARRLTQAGPVRVILDRDPVTLL